MNPECARHPSLQSHAQPAMAHCARWRRSHPAANKRYTAREVGDKYDCSTGRRDPPPTYRQSGSSRGCVQTVSDRRALHSGPGGRPGRCSVPGRHLCAGSSHRCALTVPPSRRYVAVTVLISRTRAVHLLERRFLCSTEDHGEALVLQLELGFCSSQSPFVMIRLSNGLMVTPKERPGKGLGVCDRLLPDQGPDQA